MLGLCHGSIACWRWGTINYADETTMMRLANGSQHVTPAPDAQKNFLVVDAKTETSIIEQAFDRYTHDRKDIAILLVNQHVCYLCMLYVLELTMVDLDRGEN